MIDTPSPIVIEIEKPAPFTVVEVEIPGRPGPPGQSASGQLAYLHAEFESLTGALTAGQQCELAIPYSCMAISWMLFGVAPNDAAGSAAVSIWRKASAEALPSAGDAITGIAPPAVADAQIAKGSDLSGWTSTTFALDDLLRFNLDQVETFERVTLCVLVSKA